MSDLRRRYGELALEYAGFALLVTSVVLCWRDNWLLLAVAGLECAAALYLWHDRLDVSFILIIAVLGSLAEVVFVRFGIWRYANPSLLGTPLWFPIAFGTTGLIGQRLARTVTVIWDRATSSRVSQ